MPPAEREHYRGINSRLIYPDFELPGNRDANFNFSMHLAGPVCWRRVLLRHGANFLAETRVLPK